MHNRYSLLFSFPVLLLAILLFFRGTASQQESQTSLSAINAVIGDESYVVEFGEKPDNNVPEQTRIQTHLRYVEQLLRERPTTYLSPEQRKNRGHYLDLLNKYISAGEFPRNDGHSDPRRPTFIDKNGNICAVGYLVEQTAGRQVAESVNRNYKYAFIWQIDDPAFNKWVENSGFTKTELAMIQPAYDGDSEPSPDVIETKENRNHINTGYGLSSSLLTSVNAIYLSNQADNPSMFSSSQKMHWFGLAAGTGSVLLGAFNLDNRSTENFRICGTFPPCWDQNHTETNYLRTGVSVANIAVGMVSVVRSAYHLLRKPDSEPEKSSKTEFDLTHIESGATSIGEPVPAVKFKYNF